MQNDEQQQKNRFIELSKRAVERNSFAFSEFLNIDEQDVLARTKLFSALKLCGGYENAERQIAGFCEDDILKKDFPISLIEVSPNLQKFADDLTHRDFLGTLMGLQIKREVLGDIIIYENCGYIFCLNSICDYILENLIKVKHTNVKCRKIEELPIEAVKIPEKVELVVASERLDVIISAVYKLSRGNSQKLFSARRIFINNKMTENTSYTLSEGDVVSARGFGRFIYEGKERETKKGRNVVSVRVY
ncbi:MAG: YlmH/Sll1252 family protein [Oscillospiraceae bacterium]